MATTDPSDQDALHARVSLMRQLATEAGHVAMHHFRRGGLAVTAKADASPRRAFLTKVGSSSGVTGESM